MDMDDTLLAPRYPSPLLVFKEKHGLPHDKLVLQGLRERGEQERELVYAEFLQLERHLSRASQLREGMDGFLRRLSELSIKTALLTNNHQASAEIVIAKHGLRFDHMLARDNVEKAKPHPEMILKSLEVFGLGPEEAVMIGDSRTDLEAALAVGMNVYFLATPYNLHLMPRFDTPQGLLEVLGLNP
jgi:HAD superfamily hydrolase (TIGR01509 family)